MKSMSIDRIRKLARDNPDRIEISEHAYNELFKRNISVDEVMETLVKGDVHKKEDDEETKGELTKYSLTWRNLYLTVKNRKPPFIITVRRKD